jgi:hypothetical protein
LGKRLDELLLRNINGSIFVGKIFFPCDAYAADKRCRSIIESVNGSKVGNIDGKECEEVFELSELGFRDNDNEEF